MKYIRSLLTVGLIAATLGNVMLLTGCKSVPVMATALAVSTAADYATTYRALKVCPQCREANPVIRPIIKHERAVAVYQITINYGAFRYALHLRDKGEKYWYWVPWTWTAVHTIAAANNESIARKASKD